MAAVPVLALTVLAVIVLFPLQGPAASEDAGPAVRGSVPMPQAAPAAAVQPGGPADAEPAAAPPEPPRREDAEEAPAVYTPPAPAAIPQTFRAVGEAAGGAIRAAELSLGMRGDETHRIGPGSVPPYADQAAAARALGKALSAWERANPGLDFVESPGGPDAKIEWVRELAGSRAGLYESHSVAGIVIKSAITIELGGLGCDGAYHLYSEDNLADILTHELGHYLGLGHTLEDGHLMYADDGVDPDVFDDLGYSIPSNTAEHAFAEQDVIGAEMSALEDGIAELQRDHEDLSREYSSFPPVMSGGADYQRALEVYDQLNRSTDEHNRMVGEYNVLAGRYNCIGSAA
ncbi:hypothetical protein CENSYa_1214 [Cenarchaeum symbiosum A]|uniref:Peptidase M10 metallopeptidase domain-containing protein n=1 Tax=Cenarchaeum symbiosum (strain A) TaxID=414004 RepID=A0RWX1_CENSY|nr:hypothetical protein CENSYa_1214 [Cenarchaeum symbiosum A]